MTGPLFTLATVTTIWLCHFRNSVHLNHPEVSYWCLQTFWGILSWTLTMVNQILFFQNVLRNAAVKWAALAHRCGVGIGQLLFLKTKSFRALVHLLYFCEVSIRGNLSRLNFADWSHDRTGHMTKAEVENHISSILFAMTFHSGPSPSKVICSLTW